MLMKITEPDGTETVMSEGSINIATNMIKFFNSDLGLTTDITDNGRWDWTKKQIQNSDNLKRAKYYRNEYIKFGKQPLRLV